MKLINKISIVSFITLFAFSCVQDDDYSVPQSIGQEENQKLVQLLNEIENGSADLMTISDVKNLFKSNNKAQTHTTCPFIWVKSKTNELSFIGGYDDLVRYFERTILSETK